jgi:membrane-bound lytic murein transglycosylase B
VTFLFAALILSASDGGTATAATPDAGVSWHLSMKLSKDTPARKALVTDFSAKGGGSPGEQALTAEEAEALFDDPRADLVYAEKTIAIVAPSQLVKQRKDHLDLMKMFLQPERLEAGAKFAREHEAVLTAAETKTGVDREVIIGILMWESKLGTITGDYRAFNAFISQAFFADDANAIAMARKDERKMIDDANQAKRVSAIKDRARKNLIALVRQCKARGMDVLDVKGSWAGALGFPQFMPASLRWAEDGDGDGKIDLFTFDDSIASIGRYLSAHGFKESHQKAVWEYNHEDAYVQGVLAFGDALHKLLNESSDGGSSRGR